jgi:hypothetical protein
MAASPPPDEGMLMGIPVGGGRLDRLYNLLPGLKASTFECERAQDLPPRFDQIEIGGIRRLIDKLPALMMDHEEQQIVAMMHLQIIHDGVNALHLGWNLFIDQAEKVEEVLFRALRIALRPAVPCRLPQCPLDIAHVSAPIINLLLGPLGWPERHLDGLLPRVALGADRTHLV